MEVNFFPWQPAPHWLAFRSNEMETVMGRRPIGIHPMTMVERRQRYLARREAQAVAEATSRQPPPPQPSAEQVVKLDHLRLWPERIVPWLCQRLGRRTAVAVYEAMGRAIETMPKEDDAER
jgi:hypothetical protein